MSSEQPRRGRESTGSPIGSTAAIIIAIVAVVAGFLILRQINDDDDCRRLDRRDDLRADDSTDAGDTTRARRHDVAGDDRRHGRADGRSRDHHDDGVH